MFFRLFPFALILQVFCLYHAYKNNSEQKWYLIIFFLPIIGSIFYLYHHFYNRKNMEAISEGLKGAVNSNYTIEKLEKKVKFSETVSNKIELAQEYAKVGRHQETIELYESCLSGNGANDTDIIMGIISSYYETKNYDKVIEYSHIIAEKKEFARSIHRVAFAWSLYHTNQFEEAEDIFEDMDVSFDKYPHRIEYVKFLSKIGKKEQAIAKAESLLEEFDLMQSQHRKNKREFHREIRQLHKELIK